MKTSKLLLPNGYKCAGWWILAVAAVLILLYSDLIIPSDKLCSSWNDFRALFGLERLSTDMDGLSGFSANSNLVNSLIYVLLVVGGVFIGFSRNKSEDEFIEHLRYESLILSLYFNCLLLVVGIVFVWGLSFISVMLYNMFSTLYFFIICFYIRLFINKKMMRNEE
jgi:hypothetical protein